MRRQLGTYEFCLFSAALNNVKRNDVQTHMNLSPGKIDPRLVDLLAKTYPARYRGDGEQDAARIIWAIMSRGEIYRTGHRPVLAA
jgi:hypothetical protein